MQRIRFVAAAICIISTAAAHADFIDRGNGLIYDDVLDVTWLQDFNLAGTLGVGDGTGLMTWNEAETWVNSLSVGGIDNWRLPTFDPFNARPVAPTLHNEFGSLWSQLSAGADIGIATDISPFINLPYQLGLSEWYWTGAEGSYNDLSDPTVAWRISMNCACWDSQLKDAKFYVMAVRSGDVTAVPEPGIFTLFVIGFAATSLIRYSMRTASIRRCRAFSPGPRNS